jgi:hypothetical protein
MRRRNSSGPLQTEVKEWLDGGKKRHAQVRYTLVTQKQVWMARQVSSLMLILVALLLHVPCIYET